MRFAGLPPNEEQRLITVEDYVSTADGRLPALDDLARLVALSLDLPIALVSLVDQARVRFRGRAGIELDGFERETSFCTHVVRQGVPLVVADAQADARFADGPLVTGHPQLRFYAGVPLRAENGHVVGVLSVADRAARWTARELRLLELGASQAMMHLDAHRNARLLAAERELLRVHREFFQLTPELHCTLDASLRFDELSPSFEHVLGWKREVLRAQALVDLIHPADVQRTLDEAERLIRQRGSRYDFETRCQHVEGHWVPLSWAWLARGGRIFATARDMTAYHAKEDALLAANRELQDREQKKETLLKEIHHRVKNNLQVIASLLRLGRSCVADPAALSVFNDSIARVRSIALIHERLYQSNDLAVIDLPGYLSGLVRELMRAGAGERHVHTEVLADPVALDIDRCVPIGLIVNELFTNSLKHAFDDGAQRRPEIAVGFRESGGNYELTIRDNGKGIGDAAERDGSLGLLLVSSLVRQLGGTHSVTGDAGTTFRVEFPREAKADG